ncbi:MAG TPA: acyltransferase family protein [Syntrophales bacterium]|mgnify:CR=1 FL=1|nr:acyltransferase family protein [Syntrophales bacterium]HPQ45123.1 acyltransferase family protein [Syntrophales bacterium]
MRFLGVMIIMIAHAEAPEWVNQLRNFGTPLLIVASALSYAVVYKNRELSILPFLRKRLSRLTLPVWIFLTGFFLLCYLFSLIVGMNYPFDVRTIISSYMFYNGIGFVWIFKVYIILALITPLALHYKRNVPSDSIYFISIVICYGIHELIIRVSAPCIPVHLEGFMNSVIFIIIPYSLLYLYGLKLGALSDRQVMFISASFLIVFASIAAYMKAHNGSFVPTEQYKFPPTIYYLSYALFALHAVYLFCRHAVGYMNPKVIIWLSSHSLWIYLWHIFAVSLWGYWVKTLGLMHGNPLTSLFKFLFILGFGILCTYLQTTAVKRYLAQDRCLVFRRIALLLT